MKISFKKLMIKLLSCSLALSTLFSTAGCFGGKDKDSDSDNTLEYYCWTAGYGVDWLEAMLEDFGTLDWVKEKYPNFKTKPNYNDVQSFGPSRIPLGKRNTIDLFFTNIAFGLHGSSYVADLTDSLYGSQVPGESITVGEKLLPFVRDAIGTKNPDNPNDVKFYNMPWSMSFGGIVYNETVFEKLGLTMPRTTDEFFAMMDKVKSMNGQNSAFPYTTSIISSKVTYADYLFPVWWAQYEGVDEYQNFFQAIDYDGVRGSAEVLKQTGRLKSLEIFERMYTKANGYFDRTSLNYEFKQGQVRLIRGEGGFMMVNGDWFSNEMKVQLEQHAQNGYDNTMGVMKTPIISAIIEKTPSITSDAVLAQVVDEVDAGQTSSNIAGVSQADFDIIRKARGITFGNVTAATTYVPEYASAKGLAIDFLRYMATDRANAIYAKHTTGARLPFDFDLEVAAPNVYNEMGKIYEVQRDFKEMTEIPTFWAIPDYSSYDIVSKGGLRIFGEYSLLETRFVADDTLTAQKIMDDIVDYYAQGGGYRWDKVIGDAGL